MKSVVVVVRDVPDRFRGYLKSLFLEFSVNAFVSPAMDEGVIERSWKILSDWHDAEGKGSIIMIVPDRKATGGLNIRLKGEAVREIIDLDGVFCTRKT